METDAATPRGIPALVAPCNPRATGTVQQILRPEDVGLQEELRIFNTAVYVALSCKIDDDVELVFRKQAVNKFPISNIALDKEAAFVVDVRSNRSKISGIREQVESDETVILVRCQHVFQEIGADEACCASY